LNVLTTGAVSGRSAIEAQLMLGATRSQALAPLVRTSLRTALMPIINVMASTGIISLPGMMTGQILGGVPPEEAVKYQILILSLVAGSIGIGSITAVLTAAWRLTDHRHRLRLDRLRG
jgi:putative ABC transport system permease protein